MQTLNTEYRIMQHEELIISAASKTSVTGDSELVRCEEIRNEYPWPEEA